MDRAHAPDGNLSRPLLTRNFDSKENQETRKVMQSFKCDRIEERRKGTASTVIFSFFLLTFLWIELPNPEILSHPRQEGQGASRQQQGG